MALNITITDAGRAEIINANNTGTAPVTLTHIGFTAAAFTPNAGLTALPSEIKRVSSIAGEIVAPDTISVTAKDEGADTYTMRGFGIFTGSGTLFAVYGQATPIIEKSSGSTMLLTIDVVLADIDAASLEFGDISFSNPPASLTTPGVVTLSNSTESSAQNQAATPRAVKSANDNANTRLAKNQNLADLTSAATARVNLGLGTSATLGNTALRTSASTTLLLQAAAMNDHRTSGDHDARYPQRSNNLSDLPSPSQARSNLGLGASATMGTTASRTSTSTTTVLQAKTMNDHRQSDDHDGRYPLKDQVFPSTASITDWNETPNHDCFLMASSGSAANKPPGGATYGWQVSSGNGQYKHQFATGLATGSVYWRRRNNGTWDADWSEFFHSSNLSPVETSRTLTAGDGLSGGGNLSGNRTFSVDSTVVRTARTLTAGDGLSGGGNLSADRTFSVDNTVVRTARSINTGAGLTGGGNLNADRSLALSEQALASLGKADSAIQTFNVSNWNDTPDVDCFLIAGSSAALNKPPGGSTYGWQVSTGSGNYKHQFAMGYSTGSVYWRHKNNGVWDAEWSEFYHSGNLTPVETSRSISPGPGLIGGGNLSANRTISMGTPGTLSGGTLNQASGSTHTHALNMASEALALAGNNDSALMTAQKTHVAFKQFGLGVDVAPRINDNLNNPYPSGLYYAFGALNSPGNGYILQQNFSASFTSQTYFGVAGNNGLKHRKKSNGVWTEWLDIYDQNNLASLFQGSLGGSGWQPLPGGMIFQWGVSGHIDGDANANLSFPIRFPNGCWGVFPTIRNGVTGDDEVFARPITFDTTSCTIRAEVAAPNSAVSGSGRFIHYFAIGN